MGAGRRSVPSDDDDEAGGDARTEAGHEAERRADDTESSGEASDDTGQAREQADAEAPTTSRARPLTLGEVP